MAMIGRTFLCALAFAAANATAAPLIFTSVQLSNEAVATNETDADVQSGQSPPSSTPLVTSAIVVGATDFASAGAINAPGLMSTSAEAASDTGFASAVATARFVGSFLSTGTGLVQLQLGFESFGVSIGTGFAAGSLAVMVLSNGTSVFSDVFTIGPLNLFVFVPPRATGVLDLLLTSEASVIDGGSAQNVASVTIATNTVPEPSALFLVALALSLVIARVRAQRT